MNSLKTQICSFLIHKSWIFSHLPAQGRSVILYELSNTYNVNEKKGSLESPEEDVIGYEAGWLEITSTAR
jgi:hypothetical protein